MKFSIKTAKKIIMWMMTISLTIFDMVTDILLAMDYFKSGKHYWWFALTLTFFLLSLIPLLGLLLYALYYYIIHDRPYGYKFDSFEYLSQYFYFWKQFECVAESGPQLILQLYIMSKSSMDDYETISEIKVENASRNTTLLSQDMPRLTWMYTIDTSTQTTMTNSPEISLDINQAFTLMLQILVIISALFSMSWSSTTLKRVDDREQNENSTILDYILDLLWNILCISSRVIALALFASVHSYWCAGLISGQVAMFSLLFSIMLLHSKWYIDNNRFNARRSFNKLISVLLIIILGTNSVFNIFVPAEYYYRLPFTLYASYWILMMMENTFFVIIWYSATIELDVWYHGIAVIYVIVAYILSFFVKLFHALIRPFNYDNIHDRFRYKKLKFFTKWEC